MRRSSKRKTRHKRWSDQVKARIRRRFALLSGLGAAVFGLFGYVGNDPWQAGLFALAGALIVPLSQACAFLPLPRWGQIIAPALCLGLCTTLFLTLTGTLAVTGSDNPWYIMLAVTLVALAESRGFQWVRLFALPEEIKRRR